MIGILRALFRRPKKLSWKRKALIAQIELRLIQQTICVDQYFFSELVAQGVLSAPPVYTTFVDPKRTLASIERALA